MINDKLYKDHLNGQETGLLLKYHLDIGVGVGLAPRALAKGLSPPPFGLEDSFARRVNVFVMMIASIC